MSDALVLVDEYNENKHLSKEKINNFTFYYNPKEIIMDLATRKFLENFRTDDDEDCFTLTRDEEGFVIY